MLDRELWLPAARDFTVGGLAAAGRACPASGRSRLAGASGRVVASSSSPLLRRGRGPRLLALDGDPDSAWVPDGRGPGSGSSCACPASGSTTSTSTSPCPRGWSGWTPSPPPRSRSTAASRSWSTWKQGRTRVDFPKTKGAAAAAHHRRGGRPGRPGADQRADGRPCRIPAAPGSRRLRGCVELARGRRRPAPGAAGRHRG